MEEEGERGRAINSPRACVVESRAEDEDTRAMTTRRRCDVEQAACGDAHAMFTPVSVLGRTRTLLAPRVEFSTPRLLMTMLGPT